MNFDSAENFLYENAYMWIWFIIKTFEIELRESNLGKFNFSLQYVLMVKFYFSDFNLIYINYLDMLCYVT